MTKKNEIARKLGEAGERMVPDVHAQTLIYAEHYIRYAAAISLCENKVVLDIASGSGYGSNMLSKKALRVYGVDVDSEAVEYASSQYKSDNLDFRVGNGESIPLDDNSVDVVVSFETIEHIQDYRKFMEEVHRVLKDDGLAIISTPNDLEFVEGNHFHLHEFEYNELVKLVTKHFKNIKSYYQATWKYVALGSEEIFKNEGPVEIETLNLSRLDEKQYLYFYLLCSNRQIKESIKPLAAAGEHYSDRKRVAESQEMGKIHREAIKALEDASIHNHQLEQQLNEIVSSKKYRLVNALGRIVDIVRGKS